MRHSALGAFADLRMNGLRIQKTIKEYQQLSTTHPPPEFWHKDLRWPDMDAFIKIHGESHIFIGSRPKNAAESLQRLELATGISSATNFARDSRNKSEWHQPNGKDARVLTPTTAVANLFFDRGPDSSAGGAAGIAGLEAILDQLSQQKSKQESLALTKKQRQKQAQRRPNPELSIARNWSQTRNIDVLHLLALLKTKLFEEEPVILYNYFGMHKRAVELLRLIRDKEDHKFVQYFTAEYMRDDSLISNIVLLIHHVARGSAQGAQAMGFGSRSGDEICSRIVMSAADVMRGYLAKHGTVACKELRVFCKNKKPIVQDGADDGQGKQDADQLVYSWLSLEDIIGPDGVASLQTGIPIKSQVL